LATSKASQVLAGFAAITAIVLSTLTIVAIIAGENGLAFLLLMTNGPILILALNAGNARTKEDARNSPAPEFAFFLRQVQAVASVSILVGMALMLVISFVHH